MNKFGMINFQCKIPSHLEYKQLEAMISHTHYCLEKIKMEEYGSKEIRACNNKNE